jgi:hypothetical protein
LEVRELNISERNKKRISVSDSRASACDKILADRGDLARMAIDPNGQNNRAARLSPLYTLRTRAHDEA